MLRTAALRGVAAGLAGVAVVTAAEKVEQRLTRRPSSYVPGRMLHALVTERPPEWAQPTMWNHANLVHTVVRLATDQTFENAVGVGAPPWTWPRQEQAIDVAHKAVYSFVTGSLADRIIASAPVSKAGTVSH